ncbi:hypothetical protein PYCC9005_005904 [Savitreella phatthalungensis]
MSEESSVKFASDAPACAVPHIDHKPVPDTYGPSTIELCNELNRATRSVLVCHDNCKQKLASRTASICKIMAKVLVSLSTFESILRRCVLPPFRTRTQLALESKNLLDALTALGDYVSLTMWDELMCLNPKLVALSLTKAEERIIHAVARFAEALRIEASTQAAAIDDEEDEDELVGDFEESEDVVLQADAQPIEYLHEVGIEEEDDGDMTETEASSNGYHDDESSESSSSDEEDEIITPEDSSDSDRDLDVKWQSVKSTITPRMEGSDLPVSSVPALPA